MLGKIGLHALSFRPSPQKPFRKQPIGISIHKGRILINIDLEAFDESPASVSH